MANQHKLSACGTAAVCPSTLWRPITPDTPRGVKLFLLTDWGVAIIGQMPTKAVIGWHPLPKIPPEIQEILK